MSGAAASAAGPWSVSASFVVMGAVVWVPLLLAVAQRAAAGG